MNKLEKAIKILEYFITEYDEEEVSYRQVEEAIKIALQTLKNSIPKEVIEKKIEELNDEEKEIYKKDIGNNELYRLKIIDETIKVLQELLEGK